MINKDVNMRTSLTLPKDLKSKLEVLAKMEHRSVNNLIVNALYMYVNDNLDFTNDIIKNYYGGSDKNIYI